MVRYIGVANMLKLVDAIGVEPMLVGLAAAIEEDFRRWARFEKQSRIPSHSAQGVIELMPTSDGECYGFKYVNGHPGNAAAGLQTVTAFGVLSSVATGYPLLLSEMTIATAFRTAATSALAARHLARRDASSMAIIGLGAQSEFQALAFKALLGIRHVRIFDTDPSAAAKFTRNMAARGFAITVAESAADATAGADIVTTITADKSRAVVLSDNMISAGQHINAVGGDSPGKTELAAAILRRADVFVEFAPQTRIEGEIQQMASDFPVTELHHVIIGAAPGRRSPHAITLFDSVGFAVEDFATLRFLWERVRDTDLAIEIDLVAEPEDPRDLFGLLRQRPLEARLAPETCVV